MDTVADELLIDEYYPSEEDQIKETRSLPLDNLIRSSPLHSSKDDSIFVLL